MNRSEEILQNVQKLMNAYRQGSLGGETMPEDENPQLEPGSMQNYMYFTLPMALNYQRNSYTLWKCANRLYADNEGRKVFSSREVCFGWQRRSTALTREIISIMPKGFTR